MTDDRQQTQAERRRALVRAIRSDPDAYVIAVEARSDGGGDLTLHVARRISGARAYCMRQTEREYMGETRLHLVPHRLDAPDDDVDTGTVSIAAYGVRLGGTLVEDLIGTPDE
jgi:hypothetical protein